LPETKTILQKHFAVLLHRKIVLQKGPAVVKSEKPALQNALAEPPTFAFLAPFAVNYFYYKSVYPFGA
jgi:hypothetical protein